MRKWAYEIYANVNICLLRSCDHARALASMLATRAAHVWEKSTEARLANSNRVRYKVYIVVCLRNSHNLWPRHAHSPIHTHSLVRTCTHLYARVQAVELSVPGHSMNIWENKFFSVQVYTSGKRISPRHCVQEVKPSFYQHWLLRYPPKCAAAVSTGAHFGGYLNI